MALDPYKKITMPQDLSPEKEAVQKQINSLSLRLDQVQRNAMVVLTDEHPAFNYLRQSYDLLVKAERQIGDVFKEIEIDDVDIITDPGSADIESLTVDWDPSVDECDL